MSKTRSCKDCRPGGRPRPAPHPGPRCATHHRERRKALKKAQQERHRARTYGLEPGAEEALKAAQSGVCAICQRATGATKALSVDHDHATGYVRGLLCSPCNKMLGHLRDDPAAFRRAAEYLENPPAFDVIGAISRKE